MQTTETAAVVNLDIMELTVRIYVHQVVKTRYAIKPWGVAQVGAPKDSI